MRPRAELRMTLFGHPRFTHGERAFTIAGPPKTAILLAYLALHRGSPILRDTVAFALWPDAAESESRANLRRHLYHLVRALPATEGAEPWVVSDSRTIGLSPDAPIWLDVEAYDRCAQTPAGRREAVALYNGPLLEPWDEEWIEPLRDRYRERQIAHLFALLAETAPVTVGDALGFGRRILELDPWREDALREVIRLRAASGDRAGALGEYHEFAAKLKADLGVEPMAETRRSYEEILRGEVAVEALAPADRVRGSALPTPMTSFFGRDAEVEELEKLLARERLITLTGAGGVGKTRLALALAAHCAPHFPGGVWLVELSAIRDPALVIPAVAGALGLAVAEAANEDVLIAFLSSRRTLVLVDNCEHLVSAVAPLLDTLVRYAPELRVVATSRVALDVEGETVWRVPSLAVPDDAVRTVDEAASIASVGLFVERAMHAAPRFRLHVRNLAPVTAICRKLDGIPLALELAAARMNVLTASDLETRLTDRFRVLVGHTRTTLPRQQTLRALIDWSYDLLDEREREVFRRLSVFVGGWTLEAAEIVCTSATIDQPAVLEHLTSLVAKSMVQVETEGVAARYRFLETVREYALERLRDAGEVERVRGRHARYLAELSERAEPLLTTAAQDDQLDVLALELENIRSVLRPADAAGIDPVDRLRLAAALVRFWLHVSNPSEGRSYLEAALELTPAPPAPLRAKALIGLTLLLAQSREFDTALAYSREAFELYRSLGDRRNEMFAQIFFCSASLKTGTSDPQLSLSMNAVLQEALATQDAWLAAHVLFNLSIQAEMRGERSEALRRLEESFVQGERSGDSFVPAAVAGQLARIYLELGDTVNAHASLERGAMYTSGARRARHLFLNLLKLATAYAMERDYAAAIRAYGAAQTIRERGGFSPYGTEVATLTWLAEARFALGENEYAAARAAGAALDADSALALFHRWGNTLAAG